jgi:hypothetical protein
VRPDAVESEALHRVRLGILPSAGDDAMTGPRARDPQPGDPDYGEHLARRIAGAIAWQGRVPANQALGGIDLARAIVALPEVQALLASELDRSSTGLLSSVDDVARVCQAAGLREGGDQEWGAGPVAVYTGLRRGRTLRSVVVERLEHVDTHQSGVRAVWSARFYPGSPAHLLWAAIQAAHVGQRDGA